MMKDTVEVTSVVDGRPDRMSFVTPDFQMPEGGLNIRLIDTPVAQEARMIDYKRFAAEAFARANKIDKRVWGKPGAKIGFVAAGKNWLDLVHALSLLGIDEAEAERLGITTYKVGQVLPLDMKSFHDWADGLDLIVVVEEKRKLIEVQVKEAIFDDRQRPPRLWLAQGRPGMHRRSCSRPATRSTRRMIAEKLGGSPDRGGARHGSASRQACKSLTTRRTPTTRPRSRRGCPISARAVRTTPRPRCPKARAPMPGSAATTWCSGWTATRSGFTQMGGEGANWIGEAPFSNATACVPEPRRRHLQPFRHSGDPRGVGGGHERLPTRSCSTTPSP